MSYLRSAGVKAAGQAASAEARIYFEQALAALGHLPSSPASGALGIDLRCELETPLMHLGAFETGLERLREAEALAHTTGDRNRLARVLGRITYNLGLSRPPQQRAGSGERAAAAFTDEGEPHRRLSVDVVRARARYGLGDYRQAIEICQESERLVETRGPLPPGWGPVYIRIWRVLCLAELGQFTEAEVWGEKAVSEAETSGGPPERVWACIGMGRLHVVRGAFEEAIAVLEPALRMFEGGGLAVYFPRIASSLGTAYVHSGRVTEGLALLQRADAIGASIQFRYGQPLVLTELGKAWLVAGDQARAGECASRALALAREVARAGVEAYARHLLGKVASPRRSARHHGGRDGASARPRAWPTSAGCARSRRTATSASASSTVGSTTARGAEEHLTTASTMYREMEMAFWLDKAASELGSFR